MIEPTLFKIDLDGPARPWKRFWRSTGFSPAELLLEPEMRQTLAFVGGVPRRGIEYLRVHYLLDLVKAARFGSYDWSLLDRAIDVMVDNRLRPFFELMGNPGKLFEDFNRDAEVRHWRDFIEELGRRCVERYGIEEVRGWYFETWNEPDKWWKLGGETGFDNYYDACSEGLKAVDPAIRMGGPGPARRVPAIFRSFLAHCDTGTNFFTGETGVRLDFISVHEKGARKHEEDLTPDTVGICRHEMQAVRYIREHHPRFAELPFINNECDPQIGWINHHTWHALPYFASLIAKIVDQHQWALVEEEGIAYELLSNDNGFVGRWGQRTHLAYFGERAVRPAQSEHVTDLAALERRLADPQPFDLVKKPALAVMELLAQLGDSRVDDPDAGMPGAEALRLIATPTGEGAALLLYNSADRIWESSRERVAVQLAGLQPGRYAVARFEIARGKGDPFSVWEKFGAPDQTELPTPDELAQMRAAQEPLLTLMEIEVEGGGVASLAAFDLPLPSVALLLFARWTDTVPAVPGIPRIEQFPALGGRINLVLFWSAGAAAAPVLYDVLWSATKDGDCEVLNPAGLLSTTYVHATGAPAGFYRVQARDFFGRRSEPSVAVAPS